MNKTCVKVELMQILINWGCKFKKYKCLLHKFMKISYWKELKMNKIISILIYDSLLYYIINNLFYILNSLIESFRTHLSSLLKFEFLRLTQPPYIIFIWWCNYLFNFFIFSLSKILLLQKEMWSFSDNYKHQY